jgi:hypothetical protein
MNRLLPLLPRKAPPFSKRSSSRSAGLLQAADNLRGPHRGLTFRYVICPVDGAKSNFLQPFEVMKAVEESNIMFLMEVRDRAFPVCLLRILSVSSSGYLMPILATIARLGRSNSPCACYSHRQQGGCHRTLGRLFTLYQSSRPRRRSEASNPESLEGSS